MKKFITNNWKKILIVIGVIFIIINVFTKLTANKTLLSDYIKYGKDIENSEIIENASETVGTTISESPFTPDFVKLIVILGIAILVIVILTSLGDRAAANAKAKKK